MDPAEVLPTLAAEIARVKRDRALLVGIDGIDAAGKTTLADELVSPLEALGSHVVRASLDGFHNPRKRRLARGELSPEGYFHNSFDYALLVEQFIKPAKAAQHCTTLQAARLECQDRSGGQRHQRRNPCKVDRPVRRHLPVPTGTCRFLGLQDFCRDRVRHVARAGASRATPLRWAAKRPRGNAICGDTFPVNGSISRRRGRSNSPTRSFETTIRPGAGSSSHRKRALPRQAAADHAPRIAPRAAHSHAAGRNLRRARRHDVFGARPRRARSRPRARSAWPHRSEPNE